MDLGVLPTPTPLSFSCSSFLSRNPRTILLSRPFSPPPNPRRRRRYGRGRVLGASFSGAGNGADKFSWRRVSESMRRGSERFLVSFGEYLKKEIGVDLEQANLKAGELLDGAWGAAEKGRAVVDRFRYKKSLWRKTMPKGLKIKKFVEGPGGALIQDDSYVGEDAWGDDPEPSQDTVSKIIDSDTRLSIEQKKELKGSLGISVDAGTSIEKQEGSTNWRERLGMWKEILRKDKLAEQISSINAKYVVDFDMQEVEKSLRKEVVEKVSDTQGSRALWISKRWWLYRPKLPYTYFLDKLDCSEVAAVVFSEDLKKVYVTMKEGFPLEYVVDIPLDPYLFETVSSSGVEVDLLQKQQLHYFLKVVVALAPEYGISNACGHGNAEAWRFMNAFSRKEFFLYRKEKTGVDRFSLRQAVIFICATNRPDELDSEFVRPGRIDRRLYIGLPDAKQRVQIFGVHGVGKKLAEDVDFEKLVFRTVGYSGADIRNLVNEAAIMSVRKGHTMISQQDIIDVLDKQLLEGMGVLLTEEEQQKCEENVSIETRRLLAVHEAGHILLAHIFPRFDWHAFSQLLPGGKETAISVFYPREDMVDQGYTTFGYMKMQMVVAHGGRCAERIVFGDDISDGGKDDLEKITRVCEIL
ncbi:hypothetical protein COCNU_06G014910 [Cocos nucifera]|uniref:ATP-dependent zinc metalloprotease FTSH 12, chloroplastic n=1 Tax=Cocos nucifera TaxID=13894 RepID=A0A8K0N425_COCNU|nr:hypothetical protein COCNU_06G014910 [Cocos nucifera]